MIPRGCVFMTLVILATPQGLHLWFCVKCLSNYWLPWTCRSSCSPQDELQSLWWHRLFSCSTTIRLNFIKYYLDWGNEKSLLPFLLIVGCLQWRFTMAKFNKYLLRKYLEVMSDATSAHGLLTCSLFVRSYSITFTFSADSDLLKLLDRSSLCFSNQWFMLYCSRAWLSGLSVKLELEAKLYRQIQLVQRLLANLWRTHFQATHDKSVLALANSISPSVSWTVRTNFCPPLGDLESLHLNPTGWRIHLCILLLNQNQCAAN